MFPNRTPHDVGGADRGSGSLPRSPRWDKGGGEGEGREGGGREAKGERSPANVKPKGKGVDTELTAVATEYTRQGFDLVLLVPVLVGPPVVTRPRELRYQPTSGTCI